MRDKRFSRGIFLLPNFFTTLNLFCGFYAIVKIIQSVSQPEPQFTHAAAAILLAALFDSIDGRIARLTKTNTLFGMEYDSLADLTSFCMAPALLLYTWGVESFGRVGWLAAFLFFGCGALRLARFNTQSAQKEKTYFTGLPTPIAAGVLTSIMMVHRDLEGSAPPDRLYLLFVAYVLAILMVSDIPYRSLKQVNFMKRHSFSTTIILLIGLIVFVDKPILTLLFLFAGYTLLGVGETFLPKNRRRRRLEMLLNQEKTSPFGGEPPPPR